MELIKFVALACVLIGFVSNCSSLYADKSYARVLISEDRSVEDGYAIEVEAVGKTRQLRLAPMESIWSGDAQSLTISANENGELIYERKSIPGDIKVYYDSEIGSVLSLQEGKLSGILDAHYMITSDDDGRHYVLKYSDKQNSYFDYVKVPEGIPAMHDDYVPMARNISEDPIPIMNDMLYRATTYYPEVCVIVDSTLAAVIGNDSQIYTYLAVYWNGVRQRYKTIANPTIDVKLVGAVIMRSTLAEPFIGNHLSGDQVYGDAALADLSSWVYAQRAILPAYDTIYLQTGRDMINGTGDPGLAGIEYLAAICIKDNGGNRSFACGMGEDMNGFYDGVLTSGHELGHNLGAPHDGQSDSGTASCSWTGGYMMSYTFGVIEHLYFSNCSISKMLAYLSSTSAKCVLTSVSQTNPVGVFTSTSLPGDVSNMDQQCVKLTGKSNAYVANVDDENSLCYNIECSWEEGDYIYTGIYNRPANEGSQCPSGKRCRNGACV